MRTRTPRPQVNQDYFAGRWSDNCSSNVWYRFDFKSGLEFTMQRCEGSPDNCSALKDVYSPGGSEQRFIYPTADRTLIKRGQGTLEWRRSTDNMTLKRCT